MLLGLANGSGAAPADEAAGAALLDRYVSAFNAHDPGAFAGVIATDYIQHNGRAAPGLSGLQATFQRYFQTFGQMRIRVEDRVISGDKVVARVTLTAVHDHPVQLGPGQPVFQPTGKTLSWGDIEIWRVADGKFAEHWDQSDLACLVRQLRGEP